MLCSDLMSSDVQRVLPDMTVSRAAKLMAAYNLDFLPVCNADGRPLGVLTNGDIAARVVARDRPAALTRVDEVMTAPPVFVSPETPADRVAEVMSHEGTSRLLVIADDGSLAGIVSLSDFLLSAPAELALLAAKGIHRSAASHVVSVDTDESDMADNVATTEIETNPARAEAESVVRGGTNELKEFPG